MASWSAERDRIQKGEASPSLLPHVIPAKAGISLWHTLPPRLRGSTP